MGLCAKNMVCHGDAFNVARCIVPHTRRPAVPAMATEREPLEPASNRRLSRVRTLPSHWQAGPPSLKRSERFSNCSLSHLFKETSTIVSTFEQRENVTGPRDYASWTIELLVKQEARYLFLSYLFRSSYRIALKFCGT